MFFQTLSFFAVTVVGKNFLDLTSLKYFIEILFHGVFFVHSDPGCDDGGVGRPSPPT